MEIVFPLLFCLLLVLLYIFIIIINIKSASTLKAQAKRYREVAVSYGLNFLKNPRYKRHPSMRGHVNGFFLNVTHWPIENSQTHYINECTVDMSGDCQWTNDVHNRFHLSYANILNFDTSITRGAGLDHLTCDPDFDQQVSLTCSDNSYMVLIAFLDKKTRQIIIDLTNTIVNTGTLPAFKINQSEILLCAKEHFDLIIQIQRIVELAKSLMRTTPPLKLLMQNYCNPDEDEKVRANNLELLLNNSHLFMHDQVFRRQIFKHSSPYINFIGVKTWTKVIKNDYLQSLYYRSRPDLQKRIRDFLTKNGYKYNLSY